MQDSEDLVKDLIDLNLIHRILKFVIDDTKKQVGNNFDADDIVGAILEINSTKNLNPPFDKLNSYSQLLQNVTKPDLFESLDDQWTLETVREAIESLKEWNLIFEIELSSGQYAEASKVIIQPVGLLIFQMINKITDLKPISTLEFTKWINQSHFDHSMCTLEAFQRKLRMSVRRSERLSPFNISIAILLLMYGAVNYERAFRVHVNPTESIHLYQDTIAAELTRIGKRILNYDPLSKGTLLDKIQETNKIKRILNDSKLYQRFKGKAPDGSTLYHLFFNIGSEDMSQPQAQLKFDSILQAIISNAKSKNPIAPGEIVSLFDEHINSLGSMVKPVQIKTLFGDLPSVQYLMLLCERAQSIADQSEEVEERNNDDEE